ncbi:hypothetical protein SAMD00019534_005710 [Acytostelium subglobosum LB1]|uniref:hypothetical protein n=1 Tax=Acytostelium subglobosum LB1 TaxID=1410327 RepID=UPI00064481FB|nr:hypothetical protein SAMD00019534_005710 [Acytostelium subglobosum LB1]GAM17396.1 hypothetical protein SAMD00019534_005710 [Acytostelium subglobosum LB1]|eukprot:XP_012759458.1 hypothetical protein SAMD00019534_005710 [Acytostelium subglobosum LB1]
MDAEKEYDAMVSWLPNRSIQYPFNGFKINNSQLLQQQQQQQLQPSQQGGAGGSRGTISRGHSRENSYSMSRSLSIADLNHDQLDTSGGLNASQALPNNNGPTLLGNNVPMLIEHCYQISGVVPEMDATLYKVEGQSMWITPKVIVFQRDFAKRVDGDASSSASEPQTQTEYYLFSRTDHGKVAHHIFDERMQSIMLHDQSFYFISSSGLNVIMIDQNQQQILNNLIMYEGSASANYLCALNNWNKRDLKIHALQLGLKYRQLDVVEPALKSLDLDQQLIGSRLLVNTILEYTANASNANVHNESFTSDLLHIGMNFIGLIIKDRASLVHSAISSQSNVGDINFNWTETLTTPLNEANLTLSSLNVILSPSHSHFTNQPGANTHSSAQLEDINSPIQDLLNFTTILEAFRMFQKQQQPSASKQQHSYANRHPINIAGGGHGGMSQGAYVLSTDEIDMGPWFEGLRERWERMEELEIVKESLANNTISSVIAFINWKREKHGLLMPSGAAASQDDLLRISGSISNASAGGNSDAMSQRDGGIGGLPKIIPPTGTFTLAHFRQIAACLVYQAISQDQLEQAIKFLSHLGQPIVPHLKQIALSTSRRGIRNLLLEALANHPMAKDTSIFSADFLALMEFAKHMEKLYPNASYYREFSRLSFKWRPFQESKPSQLLLQNASAQNLSLSRQGSFDTQTTDDDLKPLCQEVDDILPDTENNYGFHIVTHNIGGSSNNIYQQSNVYSSGYLRPNAVPSGPIDLNTGSRNLITLYPPIKNEPGSMPYYANEGGDGYSHFTLNWASRWSHDTRERILIDRQFELDKRDRFSKLLFAVSHSRAQDVITWVDSLTPPELQYFRSLILQDTASVASASPAPELVEVHQAILRAVCISPPYIREVLLNQLAKHRVFLLDVETAPLFYIESREKNTSREHLLLKRLAISQQLFPTLSNGIVQSHAYPLNHLLPIGQSAPFHSFFIRFCIEKKLLLLLSTYLQAYNLATTQSVRAEHTGIMQLDMLAPEAELLFLLRSRTASDLLRANVVNIATALRIAAPSSSAGLDGFISAVNSALDAGRPMMALAAMIYAPVSIASLVSEVTELGAKINMPPLLDHLRTQSPTLHALFSRLEKSNHSRINQKSRLAKQSKPRDIVSSKADITLSELLEANSIFNLSSLFGAIGADPLSVRVPDFALTSFKEGYIDRIDVFYYLEKGRPLRAFRFFAAQALAKAGSSARNDDKLHLTVEQTKIIGWLIRSFALKRVNDNTSVCAAIAFLELASLDYLAAMVKVDICVAKRIITAKQAAASESDADSAQPIGSSSNDIINVFLSMYTSPDLIPATWAMSEPLDSNGPAQAVPGTPIAKIINAFEDSIALDEPLSENDSNWAVLARFCKVHNVAKLTRRLENWARHDNWLAFLYEAQQHEFPLPQVRQIVRQFSNQGIRSHLTLILEGVANERTRNLPPTPQPPPSELISLSLQYHPIEPSKLNNDIVGYLLASFRSQDPGNYLLYYAVQHSRALLTVLACVCAASTHHSDITTIGCLVTWLIVNVPSLSSHLNGNQTLMLEPGDAMMETTGDVPPQRRWGYDDLCASINHIIQQRKTYLLIQGFKIFMPNNPLKNFLRFINQFHQYRFEESEQSLGLFIAETQSHADNKESADARLVVIDVCERLVDLFTSYEREHFLDILHRSGLSTVFSTLHSTLHLLKRTMLEDKNIRLDPKIIIQQLIEKSLFEEARKYSNENNLDKDIITLAEVESLVAHYKQGCLWEIEQERINLWKKCQQYFILHGCRPEVAGDFFNQIGAKLLPSNEKVFLLTTTIEWYERKPTPNVFQIEDLRKQILLISVGLSLESDNSEDRDSTSNSVSPSTSPGRASHLPHSSFASPIPSPSSSLSSSPNDNEPGMHSSRRYRYSVSPPQGPSPMDSRQLASTPTNTSSSTPLAYLSPAKPSRMDLVLDAKGLDNVIAKLLNSGNFVQAEQISKQFNFKSLDYEIIQTMLQVANKTISTSPHSFSPTVLTALEQSFNGLKWLKQQQQMNENGVPSQSFHLAQTVLSPTMTASMQANPIAGTLEVLASCCQHAKEAAKAITTKYNVSQKMSMSFSDPQLENHFGIVNLLLMQGKECFRLIKSFISTNHMDTVRLNEQLADNFAKAVKAFFPSSKGITTSMSNMDLSGSSKNMSPTGGEQSPPTQSAAKNGIDPNWSSEEFHEYVRLGRDPFSFGMRLLEATGIDFDKSAITSSPIVGKPSIMSPFGMEAEVELFVRAHFCFVVACSVDGSILVQNIVKSRINYYAEANQFKLLVRIITGMQSYNELQGILDILLQHDSFELLLRKKINQHEDSNGLKLALHSYLLKKQPLYQEKLEMLFYRFNMHREIAALHEQKARTLLEGATRDPKAPINNYIKDLLAAMKGFLDAADNYAKERSNRTSQQCVAMGTLVALQIKLPDIKLINLKVAEARQVMASRQQFRESLIIANAYNINAYSEWVNVLFQQVMCLGNYTFLQEYISNFSTSQHLCHDLIKRVKTDSLKATKVQHVKHFLLNFVNDKHVRYDLAKEMQFEDIANQTYQSTLGIGYFKSTGASTASPAKKLNLI